MSQNPFTRLLRFLFFAVVVRAVILVALGLTVRHRERLPKNGPAVLAGNHNSNLDALAIMSLMPLGCCRSSARSRRWIISSRSRLRGWFATNIVGIIPVKRGSGKEGGNPLLLAEEALERGEILVMFPEGTRGEPETLQTFKKGIGHLAHAQPEGAGVADLHAWARQGAAAGLDAAGAVQRHGQCRRAALRHGQLRGVCLEARSAMTELAAEEKLPAWE